MHAPPRSFAKLTAYTIGLRTRLSLSYKIFHKVTLRCKTDARRVQVHRNLDPALRPHEKEVEYTRALNAAKLQRVFAKPFLGSLPHDDGITCLARNPAQLNSLVSGAADGVVRLWDVAAQRCLRRLEGCPSKSRPLQLALSSQNF